jgi:hypothetical protein
MFTFFGRAGRPVVALALSAATSGCGGYAAASPALRPAPSAPATIPAPVTAPSSPPVTAASPATSTLAPPSPTVPPAVAPAPSTLHFPLVQATEPVRGEVIITPAPGSYRLQVQAAGLAPGSVHAVHVHFGTCPSAGVHIAALGAMVAGPGGNASLDVGLGVPYRGDGRFVIVYAGPAPGPLAACAQLAG